MCGIAGIIYRDGDGAHEIGRDMTRMLQSMKHRGPDSTGYALYGAPRNGGFVMRYKLADANTPRDFEFEDRLRRRIENISQKMLAQTLRRLERDGLVARQAFPTVPVTVEYSVTPLGRTLASTVNQLTLWAERHIGEVQEAQRRYDRGETESGSRAAI